MTDELKPCPHCGGPAKIIGYDAPENWAICVNHCQPMGGDIPRIAEAWNTRHTDSDIAGLIIAARAVVERWDAPTWKDAPHTGIYINGLREALDRLQ